MTESKKPSRILLIQHEMLSWQRAKMWGYPWHVGLEEGFRANNVELTTLVTTWFPRAKEIVAGKTFDQVWINDITHTFEPGGCGGYQMSIPELEWIAGLAPVRLGFIMESLNYTETEYAENPALMYARTSLEQTGRFMTHIMTMDEMDMETIADQHRVPVHWFSCPIPERFIQQDISLPPCTNPVFRGTAYGKRAEWLNLPELRDLVTNVPSADNNTDLPLLFDKLHELAIKTVRGNDFTVDLYDQYLGALRRIRQEAFTLYLGSLSEGSMVVNLPSFGKIYTGRVYEGMAAGRPVITAACEDRPLISTMFRDDKDLLLYPSDDPATLAAHVRRLLREPEFGKRLAENARDRMLLCHTTEKRIAQFLEWIAMGTKPRYVPAPGQKPVLHQGPSAAAASVSSQSCALSDVPPACPAPEPMRHSGRARGKLRVLLISPPYARLLGLGNCRFPLSFGHMATILSMNGHHAAIYDADFDKNLIGKSDTYEHSFTSQGRIAEALKDRGHYVWKEVEQTIRSFKPDVVGITTMTSKFPMAVRVAEIAKAYDPHIKVVIGGHHSSIFGPKLVQDKNIDFAVIGEGEMTFLELVNRLADQRPDFSRIPGLAHKNGKVTVNEPCGLLGNLDVLPIADRDLVINDGFVTENNIMTSRGCPFNCSYCGAQVIWKRKVRRRSVQNVIREIKYLFGRGGPRSVNFWDDSFTSDRKYVKEMADELKKFDGLRFSCITRLDLVEKETLVQLKEAGCSMILFGIESGNDEILKLIDKKMTRELIKQKTGMVDSVGIPWLGFFIMGYPGETRENILETLAFMKELNPSYAEINIFNPLPGTRIWTDLEQQGKVNSDMDFSKYSQASTENFFTKGDMTQGEFRELALTMAREFDKHNRSRNA